MGGGATGKQEKHIQNIQDQLEAVMEALRGKAPSTVEALVQRTDHPFSMMVMSHPLPKRFGIPQMEPLDGS